jgi:23S rRNA (guanosine2251-2'-O)-methyltransferase
MLILQRNSFITLLESDANGGDATLGLMSVLTGIHPVREALRAGLALDRVLIAKGAGGPRIQELIDLCREHKVSVRFETREQLDRAAGGANHQGVVGFGAAEKYSTLDETSASGGLHVVLDGIEDPHNLGAIVRTAHAAGAAAVVIPERRAAPLTETASRAAAGALAYLPVVKVTNTNRALEELKQKGYWIYGLDERGKECYDQIEFSAPTAIVLGAEGKGLHEHVAKHCDFLVRIPMAGAVASLNVSVAAGVVLFEWRRRKG